MAARRPPRNPLDDFAGGEGDYAAAVLRYFRELAAAVPSRKVRAGIKTGSAAPLTHSPEWLRSGRNLVGSLRKVEEPTLLAGYRSGIVEIPKRAPSLSARIGELAEQQAGRRAVEIAQALDDATRQALRQAIGRAAREYATTQSLEVLRRLEAQIRASIGLTPKQEARIARWRASAAAAGVPQDAIAAGAARRAREAIALRARAIADRGVIEAVGYARHQAWLEAQAAGELPPGAKKKWRTQGDERVRASHRAQGREPAIPLDQMYAIQRVQHPPSPEMGCRCWETLEVDEAAAGEQVAAVVVQEAASAVLQAPAAGGAERVALMRGRMERIAAELDQQLAPVELELATTQSLIDSQGAELQRLLWNRDARGLTTEARAVIDQQVEGLGAKATWQRLREATVRKVEMGKVARDRAHEALALPGGGGRFAPRVEFGSKFDKPTKARIQGALDWLRSVLAGETPLGATGEPRSVAFLATRSRRAHQLGRAVYMRKGTSVDVIVHELGHWLEQDPAQLARSVAFLERRTAGERAVTMRKLRPGYRYRASEMAKPDGFADPYTGKVYTQGGRTFATEILAVGLQQLYLDPVGFWRADPDFFNFILRFVAGVA